MGYPFIKTCTHCGFRIPTDRAILEGQQMPCSPYHVRCVRCAWPVAKTLITQDGLCYRCMDGETRRNYNRKSGRLLYGAVDGSLDPKDYLMQGRMTFHGDEAELLEHRRSKARAVNEEKLAARRAKEAAQEEARLARQQAEEAKAKAKAEAAEAAKPPPLKPEVDASRVERGVCQRPGCQDPIRSTLYCSSHCRERHQWDHFQANEAEREAKRAQHATGAPSAAAHDGEGHDLSVQV